MNNRTRLFTECVDLVGSACKPFGGTKKYVSTGAVDVDRIIDADTEIVDYDGKPSRANLEVVTGDILFAKMQGTKKTLLIDSVLADHVYSTGFCAVRAKDGVLTKRCLYHLLTSEMFLSQKDKNCSGATQKAITNAGLDKIVIQVPSIDEQNDIANQLDAIKSILTKRQQEFSAFDELIKARFVEMFGDESNPYNWPVINVEEVANVSVGVVIKPAQYYTDEEHGVKAFRSLNIGPMTIKDGDWVYFSNEGNAKNAKSQLKENDLLIVRSGAPGTACVVPKQYEGSNAIDIIIARPDTERINPYYLCTYTNMPHGKRQIEEGTGGAAQQHFNVGKYNKLRIMLPPMDRQKEFVDFVAQVDKSKAVVQKALDETQLLFDSLMQRYFG